MNMKRNIKKSLCIVISLMICTLLLFVIKKLQNNQVLEISHLRLEKGTLELYKEILQKTDKKWEISIDTVLLDEIIVLEEKNMVKMGYIQLLDKQKEKIYSINISKKTEEAVEVVVYAEDSNSEDTALFEDRITLEQNNKVFEYFMKEKELEKIAEPCIFRYYNISKIYDIDKINNYIIIDENDEKKDTNSFYMYIESNVNTDMDLELYYLVPCN